MRERSQLAPEPQDYATRRSFSVVVLITVSDARELDIPLIAE